MTKLQETFYQEGWTVQIYGSDRRLLFSLYPSHGWMLFIGVLLGFSLGLLGVHRESGVHQEGVPSSQPTQQTAPKTAPLSLD